jgi:hypothetical protein
MTRLGGPIIRNEVFDKKPSPNANPSPIQARESLFCSPRNRQRSVADVAR